MNTASKTASVMRDLESICGSDYVVVREPELLARAVDGVVPQVIVQPGTPEQVAAVLKFAAEHDLVVVPTGSFSRQHTGSVPERVDIVLETTRMKSILYYEPGDLTIGVQAGAKLGDVLATVEANGQTIPIDPPSAARATMGGVIATTASGPMRHGYGSVRDFCLGVQFATTAGKVAKAGGRVVKNVAGYDVTKLMAGSYGSLAVITSVNLRVFPKPRQTRTFAAQFNRFEDALQARDRIVLNSPLTPLALEIVSPLASRALMRSAQQAWTLLLQAAGSDRVLARYRNDLSSTLAWESDGVGEREMWSGVCDFADTTISREPRAMIMRVCVPMQRLNGVMSMAQHAAEVNGFHLRAAGRAVTPMWFAFTPLNAECNYVGVAETLRKRVGNDGVAVVTHCPREVKRTLDIRGATSNDLAAMQSVKKTLDPSGILNRGRFLL